MKHVDDKLLYRLTVQFLLYVQGRQKELDPHIVSIRQKMKQGHPIATLNSDLHGLSKAFDNVLSRPLNTAPADSPANEHFLHRLDELLTCIDIPRKFQPFFHDLHNKLNDCPGEKGFDRLLDQAVSLIIDVNKHVRSEQQETEEFLESVSRHLSQIDEQSRIASETHLASYSDRATFDADIHTQLDTLKISASSALELGSLQQKITAHLKDLTAKLQSFKLGEDKRLQESQKQLNEMSRKLRELEEETEMLRNKLKLAHAKAFRDTLTGLPNRLAYNEKIELEFKFWKRYKTSTSLIVWDIDHFKHINDLYGHKAGDKCLALVAQLLQSNCRETDFIARYGGEEFIMLMHNITTEHCLATADKIRCLIAHSDFNYQGERVQVTLSGGISEFLPDDTDQEAVFERADRALYQAKERGRNRCIVFQVD